MRQVLGGVLVAVAVGVGAWWVFGGRSTTEAPAVGEAVVSVGTPPRGKPWPPVQSFEALHAALDGTDDEVLRLALGAAGFEAIWVPRNIAVSPGGGDSTDVPRSLLARFSVGQYVRGFVARQLAADGTLYAPDDSLLDDDLAQRVLARTARQMLAGQEPPPIGVFPAAFRAEMPAEVLVALRANGTLRLWRSARDRSIASALVLAVAAARDRWAEREEVLGGPLRTVLPGLTVEVWLLVGDGTFDAAAEPMIDRLVGPGHGVGFEQPTRWRYLLPREVEREGGGLSAFRALFSQNDLPPNVLFRSDRRLYRFVVRVVSVDGPGGVD